jgi:hypothetical protein
MLVFPITFRGRARSVPGEGCAGGRARYNFVARLVRPMSGRSCADDFAKVPHFSRCSRSGAVHRVERGVTPRHWSGGGDGASRRCTAGMKSCFARSRRSSTLRGPRGPVTVDSTARAAACANTSPATRAASTGCLRPPASAPRKPGGPHSRWRWKKGSRRATFRQGLGRLTTARQIATRFNCWRARIGRCDHA